MERCIDFCCLSKKLTIFLSIKNVFKMTTCYEQYGTKQNIDVMSLLIMFGFFLGGGGEGGGMVAF